MKSVSDWFPSLKDARFARRDPRDHIQHHIQLGFRIVRPYLFDRAMMKRC